MLNLAVSEVLLNAGHLASHRGVHVNTAFWPESPCPLIQEITKGGICPFTPKQVTRQLNKIHFALELGDCFERGSHPLLAAKRFS